MLSTFVKSKALEQEVATVSRQRIALTLLSNKVDKIQFKIDDFVKRVQDATSTIIYHTRCIITMLW